MVSLGAALVEGMTVVVVTVVVLAAVVVVTVIVVVTAGLVWSLSAPMAPIAPRTASAPAALPMMTRPRRLREDLARRSGSESGPAVGVLCQFGGGGGELMA